MAYKEDKHDLELARRLESADFLKKRCCEKKIKPKRLEKLFGVSRYTVQRWKNGTTGITPSMAEKLSKLLDAPLCQILGVPQPCCQKLKDENQKLAEERTKLKLENETLKQEIKLLRQQMKALRQDLERK